MMTLMTEAAVRCVGLALAVMLCVTATRLRNPYIEKSLWSVVLITSLAMPLLLLIPIRPLAHSGATNILFVLRPSTSAAVQFSGARSIGVTTLYCLIAVVLLWRHSAGLARVSEIRRNARVLKGAWTDGLDVRATPAFTAPATFGSTILLPVEFGDWPNKKLAAVIAHERSHVLERDAYLLWLSRLNTCLFWFNPMAWWLDRRLAALAEATSDAAALSTVGNPPAYAEILLEFAGRACADRAVVPIARSMVATRIERIIGGTTSPGIPPSSRRWFAVAALLPVSALTVILLRAVSPGSTMPSNETPGRTDATPRILSWGGSLEKYYPPEAARLGIDGTADVAVILDPLGHPTEARILSEHPHGMGFAAAASAVARSMTYSNPTGHSVRFAFRVKFTLNQETTPEGDTRQGTSWPVD